MSSRALRRAQRDLEEKHLQGKLYQQEQENEVSDPEVSVKAIAKPSLFAMLGDDGGDDEDNSENNVESQGNDLSTKSNAAAPSKDQAISIRSSKKSKKKKKKTKAKSNAEQSATTPEPSSSSYGLDEIDQALLALNLASGNRNATTFDELESGITEEKRQLFTVLSIDTQHLHSANEMKKLFGRAALQDADDQPRQRQRGGIAAAVAGRIAGGARGLAALGLRRNIFVQGKEEWPRATSGGLSMEIVEKRADGSIEYRFVHNRTYQEVQRQFQVCVGSMEPDRMVQLLQFNPYHISTLLQVSEIAKQQRDNATASDLLERALFTFGRSIHSTFNTNLVVGKARLDFRHPENREFWLAVWRYIGMLGVRATWRTALEWARLLIAMDPEQDPYCIRLLLDQLCLRGREPQILIDTVGSDHLQRLWKIPPNLAFSVALAHDRLKQPAKARSTLRNAIREYPWVAARLCKELDISPIPLPVWGKEPNGDHQELLCRLYVPKAKDLWNTTEGTSLLVEVCYTFQEDLTAGEDPYWLAPIPELNVARHVILSDDRNLLSLLDNHVKSKYTSVSDPLPPEDSISSYDPASAGSGTGYQRSATARQSLLAELEEVRRYFQRLHVDDLVAGPEELTEEILRHALEEARTTMDEFRRNTERFERVRTRLLEEGVQVVFDGEEGLEEERLVVESEEDEE